MQVDVARRPPEGATLALAVADPPDRLPELAARLEELLVTGEASAERGRARLVHLAGRRLVVAGAGPRAVLDADALRDAAAAAARELRATVGGDLRVDPRRFAVLLPAEQARAIVEGVVLGSYDPGAWRSSGERAAEPGRLTLVTGHPVGPEAAEAVVAASWTNQARDLANGPANELTPVRLAERAGAMADRFSHLSAEALGPAEMRAHGMGALLGVGSWQPQPATPDRPALRAAGSPASADVLGLVGKGITFDTGGISLKPAAYLEDMKGDMAGGAAVIAAMGAHRRARPARSERSASWPQPRTSRAAAASGQATSSRRRTARRSRSPTRTPRAGSCSPTRSSTPASRAPRTSSTSPP